MDASLNKVREDSLDLILRIYVRSPFSLYINQHKGLKGVCNGIFSYIDSQDIVPFERISNRSLIICSNCLTSFGFIQGCFFAKGCQVCNNNWSSIDYVCSIISSELGLPAFLILESLARIVEQDEGADWLTTWRDKYKISNIKHYRGY